RVAGALHTRAAAGRQDHGFIGRIGRHRCFRLCEATTTVAHFSGQANGRPTGIIDLKPASAAAA
ncbi:MAG TPA: hypothetical protein VNQ74_08490, partial [Burkholderiaceae bacterium]|nr:hypothetical protein [Burkholderiaceae bacterium]